MAMTCTALMKSILNTPPTVLAQTKVRQHLLWPNYEFPKAICLLFGCIFIYKRKPFPMGN